MTLPERMSSFLEIRSPFFVSRTRQFKRREVIRPMNLKESYWVIMIEGPKFGGFTEG